MRGWKGKKKLALTDKKAKRNSMPVGGKKPSLIFPRGKEKKGLRTLPPGTAGENTIYYALK